MIFCNIKVNFEFTLKRIGCAKNVKKTILNLQYWQYQVGQEKSACHFHKKKLTVSLQVKDYRWVIGECILKIEMSYKVMLGTL